MTPEQQRIAIAEACGWEKNTDSMIAHCFPEQMKSPTNGHVKIIPDYLSDLNAMHEAEKVLKYEKLPVYVHILRHEILMKDEGVSDFDLLHATAAQRAEAFLRCLNLWQD
jgi:hypothetical protein